MRIVRIPVIALLGVAMVAALGCSQKPGGESSAGKTATTESVPIVPLPPAPAPQAAAPNPATQPPQPAAPKPAEPQPSAASAAQPAPAPRNYVPNASMDKWTQVPAALTMNPPRVKEPASTVTPYEGKVPGDGKGFKQVWKTNDAICASDTNYDAVVSGVAANTTYRLTFQANNLTKAKVAVSAAGLGGSKVEQLLLEPIATKEGFQNYEFRFTTRADTTKVRFLTTAMETSEKFTGEVVWADWKMAPELPDGWSCGGAMPAKWAFKAAPVDHEASEGNKALERRSEPLGSDVSGGAASGRRD